MITTVRPAGPGEGAAVAGLESDARRALVEQRGGPERLIEEAEVGGPGWELRIADPTWLVLLASIDDYPVGWLSAALHPPRLEIDAVWVEPDARELGFGDELLIAALEFGRDHGAVVAESFALPGDRATKNLFERFGMKARLLVVSRTLADFEH